jgi:hypothetical protein
MKKALIVAGLISLAGLAVAAPAAADPASTVSCSPMPLCQINGEMGAWQQSVTDYFTKGPKTFQGSVTKFVQEGPKTFQRTLLNPGSEDYDPDPNPDPAPSP